tara:strand:- start:1651 stop:2295 length:645 start_codon:yes stop_codon:yes gene_type:complete
MIRSLLTYSQDGIEVKPSWVHKHVKDAYALQENLIETLFTYGKQRDVTINRNENGDTRIINDTYMDYDQIKEYFPDLLVLYKEGLKEISKVLGEEIIKSPYGKSAMTLKLYKGINSEHGWHTETNSVTGLVYFTDIFEEKGGALQFSPIAKRMPIFTLCPSAFSLVVLRGHDLWHRVTPMKDENAVRVCLVMNYYLPNDINRPKDIDALHYGEK